MAGYDDRLAELLELVGHAQDGVSDVSEEQAAPYAEAFERADEVLDYAGLVLAKTDAVLMSGMAVNEMQGALVAMRDNVAGQPESLESWTASLLNGLASVPVAHGEEMAQQAREAAGTLQRSATARARAVSATLGGLQQEVATMGNTVEERKNEIDTAFAERRAEADLLVTEMRTAADESRARMQAVETEQADGFREAQEEREGVFGTTVQALETDARRRIEEESDRAVAHLEELQRMEAETKQLVEAIGDYGTGGRYAKEVRDQKSQADGWRIVTVIVVVIAAAVALWAARHASGGIDDPRFVSKVLITVALGGLAGYTAKQSSRHRQREESARALELDMAAFPAFIENMEPEKQQAAREMMLPLLFGRPLVPPEHQKDAGPTPRDQLEELVRRSGQDGGVGT